MYTNSASRGQSRPRASAHRSAELSSRRPDSYARGARTRHAMRHGRRDWHNRQRPTREQTRQAAPTATPNDTVGRKRIRTLLHKVTYQSDGKSRNIFSKRIKTNFPFFGNNGPLCQNTGKVCYRRTLAAHGDGTPKDGHPSSHGTPKRAGHTGNGNSVYPFLTRCLQHENIRETILIFCLAIQNEKPKFAAERRKAYPCAGKEPFRRQSEGPVTELPQPTARVRTDTRPSHSDNAGRRHLTKKNKKH